MKVNRDSRREFTRSKYTEKIKKFNDSVFADKMRSSTIADDMIRVATRWRRDGKLTHARTDYKDFAHGDILMQAGQNKYTARIVIGITPTDQYVFYDVVDMRPARFDIKEGSPSAAENITANSDITGDPSFVMLPNDEEKVKSQFSLSPTDDSGRELTQEQHFEAPRICKADG